MKVWTIGYGSRSKERVLDMLRRAGIEVVVDVRRWPRSRSADFNRESMERWLREAGIDYIWMGDKLGGYRRGGYERYMETEEFKRGVEELMRVAEDRRVCILCLEESPKGCHRRFIARYLEERGVEVEHL